MSCKVCSSGEELDLLKGWEGWKERSTAGRAPSEEMARSMGIPPAASSSKGDFSSWLDAEDDCRDSSEETLLGGTQAPGSSSSPSNPLPVPAIAFWSLLLSREAKSPTD